MRSSRTAMGAQVGGIALGFSELSLFRLWLYIETQTGVATIAGQTHGNVSQRLQHNKCFAGMPEFAGILTCGGKGVMNNEK